MKKEWGNREEPHQLREAGGRGKGGTPKEKGPLEGKRETCLAQRRSGQRELGEQKKSLENLDRNLNMPRDSHHKKERTGRN